LEGTIAAADDRTVTIQSADGTTRTVHHDEIERARTTFAWASTAKPERNKKS
jgi:ribosome maturation factor RimP